MVYLCSKMGLSYNKDTETFMGIFYYESAYCHVNHVMSQIIRCITFIFYMEKLDMTKYIVTLSEDERKKLTELTAKGKQRSQTILNALILLGCDAGEFQTERSTNEEMSRVLKVSMRKIDRLKKRFVEEGFDAALDRKKGTRIYAKKTDGDFEAHLIALSCSEPPEGFVRWSLRLLSDKVVELHYIDNISHESVRRILKKRNQTLAT